MATIRNASYTRVGEADGGDVRYIGGAKPKLTNGGGTGMASSWELEQCISNPEKSAYEKLSYSEQKEVTEALIRKLGNTALTLYTWLKR